MTVSDHIVGHARLGSDGQSGALVLTLLPSTLVVILAPVYIYHNLRQGFSSQAGLRPWCKLIIATTLISTEIQLCTLPEQALPDTAQILATCIYLGFLCLVLLLYVEHRPLFGPASWLAACLFANIVVDAVKAHSMLSVSFSGSSSFIAIAIQKGILIILETNIWDIEEPADSTPRHQQGTPDDKEQFGLHKKYYRAEDLPNLDDSIMADYLRNQFSTAWAAVDKARSYSLYTASALAFPHLFLRAIFLRICVTASVLSQPFLMKYVLHVSQAETKSLDSVATIFALTTLVFGGIAVSRSQFSYSCTRLSLSIRGAISALTTEKLMLIRSDSEESSAAITILNSNLDSLEIQVNEGLGLFGSLTDIVVGMVLLHTLIGVASLLTLLPIILHFYLIKRRNKTAQLLRRTRDSANQSWTSGISRIVSQLKDIKMAGLLPKAFDTAHQLLSANADSYRMVTDHWTVGHMFSSTIELYVPFMILISSMLQADPEDFNSSKTFPSLALATLLVTPMMQLPDLFPSIYARMATISRIQEFLNCTEYIEYRTFDREVLPGETNSISTTDMNASIPAGRSGHITFSELSVPSRDGKDWAIRNLSGEIRESQLSMVIGAVGQGKSMLLKAILGETHQLQGIVRMSHKQKIAYCGQKPWFPNTTIRLAILGANSFNPSRYERVIRACDLEQDLALLEAGDESSIGSDGCLLSGGQKQRLALARALYANTPIVVLDDIFASLDRITARRVFARLFGKDGLLRRSSITTVLGTHSLEYLSEADQILAFNQSGALERLESHFDVQSSSAVVEATRHSEHFATDEACWDEGYSSAHLARQEAASPLLPKKTSNNDIVSRETYGFLYRVIPRSYFLMHLLCATATVCIQAFPEIFAEFWISSNILHGYFLIYITMLLYHPIVHFGMYNFHIRTRSVIVARLYSTIFHTMLRADIATLTRLDHGDLISRVTVDLSLVVSVLDNIMAAWFLGLGTLIDFTLLLLLASGFSIAIPVLILAVIAVQRNYIGMARQLKLLNLESRSAVCTNVIEVSGGLPYLRAFQWQQHFMQKTLQRLDSWQKASYYSCSIHRWFRLTLELTILAAALLVVSCAVSRSSKMSPASVSTAMFILMHASHKLCRTMTAWIILQGDMSGISRIQIFVEGTATEGERLDSESELPADWPNMGHLELWNVNAGYRTSAGEIQPALQDIAFKLMPGYRIGVVGRTGSGKTSLALTILNSLPFDGRITLDDIDISTVASEEVRRRVTIITQNFVEMLGTVRDNLVPSQDDVERQGRINDRAIHDAVRRVGLSEHIEEHGGLDALFSNMDFSQGQKQLVCLARAILHNSVTGSKLVIIDEATSSMDYDTDSDMQKVISDSFAGCTIIIIAHRVESLKNVDYLLELEDGRQVSLIPCSERARLLEATDHTN